MNPSKNAFPIVTLILGIAFLSTAAYMYFAADYNTELKEAEKQAFVSITQETLPYAPKTETTATSTPTPTPAPTFTPIPTATPTPTPKPTPTPNPLCKISVSYSASLAYNNHVGNEWGYSIYVDGELVGKSSTYSFEINDDSTFTIKCYAIEYDSISDSGSSSMTIKVAELDEGKTKVAKDVIVRENRGRYSGNTACWTFTITINKKDY